MTYYILQSINTPHPSIYRKLDGYMREFRTYKEAKKFIKTYELEGASVVSLCSDERNYLV